MSNLRIHQIINSYSLQAGGAERLARRLHLALLERGVDSYLLGLEKHDDDAIEGAMTLKIASSYSWRAIHGIRRYLRAECREGDIVHAHLFPTMGYVSLLRGGNKARLIATEHNTVNRRRGSLLGYGIDAVTYAGYDRVACISQATEESLLQWHPKLGGRTIVVPNGVPLRFHGTDLSRGSGTAAGALGGPSDRPEELRGGPASGSAA